jgi:UTP--glucose-1-phosphate uridylyltransferase
LVLFGDDIIDNEKSAALQLVELFYRKNNSIIGTVGVSDEEVSQYGIIEAKNRENNFFSVEKFLEKPAPNETTSRSGVV